MRWQSTDDSAAAQRDEVLGDRQGDAPACAPLTPALLASATAREPHQAGQPCGGAPRGLRPAPVREVAVAILSKLPVEEFGKLAAQVALVCPDSSRMYERRHQHIAIVDQAELVAHTDACVQQLEKDDIMLREAAIDTLRKLAQRH